MIANTFIKRPVTAIVISVVLIIAGLICMSTLAVDQYPNIFSAKRFYEMALTQAPMRKRWSKP